ncbi:MAG: ABC transporter ATP-binding protein [Erysipelotrichaceae bacterium]|nr:ABC transporter ATP-binding protein [Erysipelotrichaceae bacterium]
MAERVKEPKGVMLDHISKIYKDPKTGKEFYAVHDVALDIKPGSFVTLLGPSGCGKTTTLRMIAGFESPDEGEIYLGGEPINALTPNKRDTAMVFQSYALFPHYNVFDNVAYGLRLRKVPKDEIKHRVTDILALVELSGMEQRMTNQLSGGQQQRVALARALVVEPGVLLFDEPLSNLDAKLRNQMRAEIIKLRKRINTTFIYVTHDQTEAMTLGDRIVVMKDGFIQQIGTPQEVYDHPRNLFVSGFIGTPQMNYFDARLGIESGSYYVESDGYRVVLDEEKQERLKAKGVGEQDVILGVRPDHIQLGEQGIKGKVEVSELMGPSCHLHLNVSDKDVIAIVPTEGRSTNYIDKEVNLSFNGSVCHIFSKEDQKNLEY